MTTAASCTTSWARDGSPVTPFVGPADPEHRAVVDRSDVKGWSTADIAADLGIAEGTVKSRLHYALRTLRNAY